MTCQLGGIANPLNLVLESSERVDDTEGGGPSPPGVPAPPGGKRRRRSASRGRRLMKRQADHTGVTNEIEVTMNRTLVCGHEVIKLYCNVIMNG